MIDLVTQSQKLASRLARRGTWRRSQAKKNSLKTTAAPVPEGGPLSRHISTFPKRFEPLAERLYQDALQHPAWKGWEPQDVRRSIENRLWSYLQRQPWWFGMDRPKRPATGAQLASLAKARQARREQNEPYKPESVQER